MHSPYSPSVKKEQGVARSHSNKDTGIGNGSECSLLTPPNSQNSTSSIDQQQILTSPATQSLKQPTSPDYYQANLNKPQFNSILVYCTSNLLKILYTNHSTIPFDEKQIKIFIIEVLKRSKTSIQSLQLTCFYIYKLINSFANSQEEKSVKISVKNLFLGLIIISSKFNQDYNYSFKSWCKICGLNIETPIKLQENIKNLKQIEIYLIDLLKFELYLNGDKYENWCNILFIFGFDFIKYQKCFNSEVIIEWDLDIISNNEKLNKWFNFFQNLKIDNLNLIKISFESFYKSKIGDKILYFNESNVNRKRCFDDNYNDNTNELNQVKKVKAC
ncbi:PCL5 [Candida jiufengensis]|uniref:PCL5 n=1 Tax=Candida jiufengensis TaxID=497108 RepID=UPI00222586FD|nr:PCL5 [Candida jiufengensis]KAI5956281.1 PCL5 [Candida jiufengensis]